MATLLLFSYLWSIKIACYSLLFLVDVNNEQPDLQLSLTQNHEQLTLQRRRKTG